MLEQLLPIIAICLTLAVGIAAALTIRVALRRTVLDNHPARPGHVRQPTSPALADLAGRSGWKALPSDSGVTLVGYVGTYPIRLRADARSVPGMTIELKLERPQPLLVSPRTTPAASTRAIDAFYALEWSGPLPDDLEAQLHALAVDGAPVHISCDRISVALESLNHPTEAIERLIDRICTLATSVRHHQQRLNLAEHPKTAPHTCIARLDARLAHVSRETGLRPDPTTTKNQTRLFTKRDELEIDLVERRTEGGGTTTFRVILQGRRAADLLIQPKQARDNASAALTTLYTIDGDTEAMSPTVRDALIASHQAGFPLTLRAGQLSAVSNSACLPARTIIERVRALRSLALALRDTARPRVAITQIIALPQLEVRHGGC